MPEQRIPDVPERSREYLPDPDVKMSYSEWHAVSWEMDFGTQSDEQETPEITNKIEQTPTQEVTHTNDVNTTKEVAGKQTERTENAESSSPEVSITTDVGVISTYDAPLTLKVHLYPRNHRVRLLDIIRVKQQNTTCGLTSNIMLTLTIEDLML